MGKVIALIAAAIAVLALLWALTPPADAAEEPVDVAIVFVMDISGSMQRDEIAFAREAHVLAITSEPMVTAIVDGAYGRVAMAYVEYADGVEVRVNWTIVDGPESAFAFARQITALPPGHTLGNQYTMIGAGLLAADRLLSALPYAAGKIVVDVVGDGTASDFKAVDLGRAAILSRGATINAMPLMLKPDNDLAGYFERYVIGGPAAFAMPVKMMSQLPQALRSKIVLELY
ncbi:DUF1194 domain-containing protein [Bauldia litoralis]|uniref:DUF1194 domain-containing protein n=1 Tax=Bauldia litoralis TaxID=665467 RepID=UPI0032652109